LLKALSGHNRYIILQVFAEAGAPLRLTEIHRKLIERGVCTDNEREKPRISKHLNFLVRAELLRKNKYGLYEPLSTEAYNEIFGHIEGIERTATVSALVNKGIPLSNRIKTAVNIQVRNEAQRNLRPIVGLLLQNDNWIRLTPERKKEVINWAILSQFEFSQLH